MNHRDTENTEKFLSIDLLHESNTRYSMRLCVIPFDFNNDTNTLVRAWQCHAPTKICIRILVNWYKPKNM